MSAEEIANAFITHYYTTLDSNPSQLAGLYVSLTYCDRQTKSCFCCFEVATFYVDLLLV